MTDLAQDVLVTASTVFKQGQRSLLFTRLWLDGAQTWRQKGVVGRRGQIAPPERHESVRAAEQHFDLALDLLGVQGWNRDVSESFPAPAGRGGEELESRRAELFGHGPAVRPEASVDRLLAQHDALIVGIGEAIRGGDAALAYTTLREQQSVLRAELDRADTYLRTLSALISGAARTGHDQP